MCLWDNKFVNVINFCFAGLPLCQEWSCILLLWLHCSVGSWLNMILNFNHHSKILLFHFHVFHLWYLHEILCIVQLYDINYYTRKDQASCWTFCHLLFFQYYFLPYWWILKKLWQQLQCQWRQTLMRTCHYYPSSLE